MILKDLISRERDLGSDREVKTEWDTEYKPGFNIIHYLPLHVWYYNLLVCRSQVVVSLYNTTSQSPIFRSFVFFPPFFLHFEILNKTIWS